MNDSNRGPNDTHQGDWRHEMRDEALKRVKAERHRQYKEEGYNYDHDDQHFRGELADAAAYYAATSQPMHPNCESLWPFADPPAKIKHTRLEQLAIAGALIVAEMERILREENKDLT